MLSCVLYVGVAPEFAVRGQEGCHLGCIFFIFFCGGMNWLSYDDIYMRVPLLVCVCFFPGVFFHSMVTGASPLLTDLIMRVHVIATT